LEYHGVGAILTFQPKTICATLVLLGTFLTIHGGNSQKPRAPGPADLVLVHAKIYTVNRNQPWAEALGITGDKITAVGTEREIELLRGPKTQIIDARGRVVLPGFTDSHIHFLEGSLTLVEADLNGVRSIPEIKKRLTDYANSHPGKGWIVGLGWTYDLFAPSGLPNKKILDELFPDRPVYLESYDTHTGWVNARALAISGITKDTPNPPGGKIIRNASTGEPSGALVELARHLVKNIIPPPTREEKLAALRKGLALANQNGIVRVHAAGEPPDTFGDFFDLDLFDELRREGRLTVRFYISRIIEPPELTANVLNSLEEARERFHNEWISVGAAKFFLDGAIETHTGALLTPYTDDATTSGMFVWAPEHYKKAVMQLDASGFQIFSHAVGDRAVRLALDTYDQAERANHQTDLRHRIEHVETISPDDIPRFARLGVIASMQPLHADPDPDTEVWIARVGPEREKFAWAWRSLLDARARLAFGSDWEVVTMNPWAGIHCAVTRQNAEGKPPGGWIPEQRISIAEAIAGYTSGAAYAGHRENTEGSLEPGKLADLIIISQNPFEVDPGKLTDTKALFTMVGGKTVFQSSEAAEFTEPIKARSRP
jgi:predicted amidohydrolase YtcJ